MSFELRDIFLKKRNKILYDGFSLILENKNIITCLYNNRKEKKIFIDTIIGKIHPYIGEILLNNIDVITFSKNDRKISLIKAKKLILTNFIPIKFRMFWSLIFDPIFIYKNIINYYYKISENLINVGKNNQQIELKISLDNLFENYIQKYIQNKIKLIHEYLDEEYEIHKKNINELIRNNVPDLTKKWLSTFLYKGSEINAYHQILIFLQALWDEVSSFKELRLACDCEKKIHDKKIKINKKDFYFNEVINIIDKQLRIISIEIYKIRLEILLKSKQLKKYKKAIIKNIDEYNVEKEIKYIIKKYIMKSNVGKYKIIKNKQEINNYLNSISDLKDNFLKKQRYLITDILPSDFFILKSKVITLIHDYHKLLLNKEINNLNKKEYKKALKTAENQISKKTEIGNVYFSMYEKSIKLMKKLGINYNFALSNIFSADFIKVKMFIINSLLSGKEILILDKIFDNLSNKEQNELGRIISKIFHYYPKIKIFIITNKFLYNNVYDTKYLLLTDYSNLLYNKEDFSSKYIAIPKNLTVYKSIFRKQGNFLRVNINRKYMKVNDDLHQYLKKIEGINNKIICINPLYINFSLPEDEKNKEGFIQLIGKIKKSKRKIRNYHLILFKTKRRKKISILCKKIPENINDIKHIFLNKKYIIKYNK